jgi:hypothetical protein
MAKYLNTSGISFYLEELIKNAQDRLVIISPYIDVNPRVKQLLEEANSREIIIDLIYGKVKIEKSENEWLKSLKHMSIYFSKNLHAKCYMNEKNAILTSMNLYEFSQVSNIEMGVFIEETADSECYVDLCEEVERLIKFGSVEKRRAINEPSKLNMISSSKELDNINLQMDENIPAQEKYEKLTTAKMAELCCIKTTSLFEYFVMRGYLEVREGKHYLTDKGRSKNAEVRFSKTGVYFLWPKVMLKKYR